MSVIGKMVCTTLYIVRSALLRRAPKRMQESTLCVKNTVWTPDILRHMSMWPKGFEDPVIHKSDFPTLRDTGEYQTKAVSPIKSAPTSATCSLFKDRTVQKFQRLCTLHGRSEVAENNMRVSKLAPP